MLGFSLHPNVYAAGDAPGLIRMLEEAWVREVRPGEGTLYVVSGFANYNGGVRFYEVFRHHVESGGRVVAILGGSTRQSMSSRQVVNELLASGAEVHVINRRRILHAKLYGASSEKGDRLIVTSGNFTGPGMGQNVESAVILDPDTTAEMGFSWQDLIEGIFSQSWHRYQLTLGDQANPGWTLLYDEHESEVQVDESEEVTMVLKLGHSDTARIQAVPGTKAAKGTQYFWLSNDTVGFFPPLTIRNEKGQKATFSCLITVHYMDLKKTAKNTRVTFEAENNVDFRLGTGQLRYTKQAKEGDLALITRIGEREYELRIAPEGSSLYATFDRYATTFIGKKGKRFGFVDNDQFATLSGVSVPDRSADGFEVIDVGRSGPTEDE